MPSRNSDHAKTTPRLLYHDGYLQPNFFVADCRWEIYEITYFFFRIRTAGTVIKTNTTMWIRLSSSSIAAIFFYLCIRALFLCKCLSILRKSTQNGEAGKNAYVLFSLPKFWIPRIKLVHHFILPFAFQNHWPVFRANFVSKKPLEIFKIHINENRRIQNSDAKNSIP